MRAFFAGFVFLAVSSVFQALASPAQPPAELEHRLLDSAEALKDVMEAPDGGIPSDLIKRCRAIIIFPSVLKAGLGIGGHYGRGVIVRRDSKQGRWGPPAFLTLTGGSVGWQAGVQTTQLVLLVMGKVSLRSVFQGKFTVGADAAVSAGPVGRNASASVDVDLSSGILSYSQSKGLYAGLSVQGSVLEPDWDANESYYGSGVSIIDRFFQERGKLSPAGTELVELIGKYSGR
jgi:SH3 domain-containing YSC84-like protein 1